jgi:uncharacterized protein YjbI with pentapeptide repeats
MGVAELGGSGNQRGLQAMKTIKPQKLGVLCRAFEQDRQPRLAVALLLFFPFESPSTLLPEVSLWKFAATRLGKDVALDAGMPKVRGELLLHATAYPPGGVPAPACAVRAKLGLIDKTLYVIGDRVWRRGAQTEPVPFTKMPIDYARAFGGPGFASNPLGKGFARVRADGGDLHPLPNIEDPRHLIRSPGDRPAPAGFGPYDVTWPQRTSKAGTYDGAWLRDCYPGLPADADLGVFNTAPDDQQIPGHFSPADPFTLENMHPTEPLIEARLPAMAARCFVNQRTAEGEVFREVAMALETVQLFPAERRGIVLFRGVIDVLDEEAADVLQLVAGAEAMGAPKSREHYQQVLAQRLDKARGHLYGLRDVDLLPPSDPSAAPILDAEETEIGEMTRLLAREGLVEKHARRGAEIELDKAREQIRAQGLDPDAYVPAALPPEEPPPDLDNLAELVDRANALAEEQKASAETKRAEVEEQARALCAEHGLDYEQIVADRRREAAGPPKFSAQAQIDHLQSMVELAANAGVELPAVEAQLADPKLRSKLEAMEAQLRNVYVKTAHHLPAASPSDGEASTRARDAIAAVRRDGASLRGRDFTGADLVGVDARGVDLRDALLECANLGGADLSGADLSGAVLARADLSRAKLTGAKLAGANLGMANLTDASAGDGVDLTGAVLAKADLSGADLHGAKLVGADLSEAVFKGTNFSGVTASGLNFLGSDLSGLTLRGADLGKCNFIDVTVAGVDFTGAKLPSAVFLGAKGDRAIFRDADLENLRVVQGSAFNGASFEGARLARACLRGTELAGCDFTRAQLDGADLSECALRGATFYRAVASDARFVKADLTEAVLVSANLMHALLQRATLCGADLRGANLFRADLFRVRVDGATKTDGAELTEARVLDVRGTHGQA